MKFSIEKDPFLEALQKVQSIVQNRPAVPILSNILIEATSEGLVILTATDQDVTIRTQLEAEVITPGTLTLPAKRFFQICRLAPTHQIHIEVELGTVAQITSGSSLNKLEGLSATEFPSLTTQVEGGEQIVLKQAILRDLLYKTSYASSTDESRAILNGSLLSFREGKLTTVCTDGRRLALVEYELEAELTTELDIVVPSKTVGELIKTLSNSEDGGEVKVVASATQAAFEFGKILLITKLVEGTYPNYKQVIPSQCEHRIAIERDILVDAIMRTSVMVDEQSASVLLTIHENKVELMTSSPEVGESHEVIPVKYEGDQIRVAFNPSFLLAPLKHLESDEVYLEISDELSPGVIKQIFRLFMSLCPFG